MNFLSDLHTHSIVSGHGYSTLLENINYCKENGIKILGTSEHGPKMPGSPHRWYFHNIQNIPRIINNIIILRGCEANILDTKGNIDLEPFVIPRLDYLILSFHEAVFSPNTLEN
ncbi:TPA: phosphatase, partial [Clostridioides difficile]|nr:phosphatase [Clostridioides difficile]